MLGFLTKYGNSTQNFLHICTMGSRKSPSIFQRCQGQFLASGRQLQLEAKQIYRWHVNALSPRVVQFLKQWLTQLPQIVDLRDARLEIKQVSIAHPSATYAQLLQLSPEKPSNINFSFVSPTSFRRKGHHFPLPVPVNLFHSYLRRWNDFSGIPIEQEPFLAWIDEGVIIHQHRLESMKVAAGKRGSVTGFTGVMSCGLSKAALANSEFTRLFYALARLAPYCGTGHKTTFGLGQTRLDWVEPEVSLPTQVLTNLLGERIDELTALFTAQRKRTGGDRADKIASTWATILARREMGESLQVISQDLEMPYATVKTYVKLARRALRALAL
jgi:CRISPR-associated endoribonuclease Cas6